ncbi:hypothetical protein ASE95_12060 [Sphingomonas sp. Leaf231]|uniref:glycosyltransferase n=1 Tax=Sphingomonas sp. Leaf231 TaxID=1736301 RepID=UPI0006F70997|nr:glycosyltransferase [Sphingomonas sp. Leaf231]KQN90996.1 hypothetical protein ASE95_12060 [Sphingomonas sp. Leaf231]
MENSDTNGGVSAYFYAGDFVEAARRHAAGEPQSYATHDELIRTFAAIGARGRPVDIYSFCAAAHPPREILPNVRVTALGGQHHRDLVLVEAFRRDPNPAVICHFPSLALHYHIWRSRKRALSVMASSFNVPGLRPRTNLTLLRFLLNRPRFDFVANHCAPATELLARSGVRRDKLLAWNIPFHRSPAQRPARTRNAMDAKSICYVGSINESKGVGDLLRAVATLRDDGIDVQATIVGGGEVAAMQDLATELGIADRVHMTGLIDNDRAFDIMGESDAVIVPSRHDFQEGFPLVLFEAIASRTPIVCSDHPIFATAFADGVDALLFTQRDHRDLARQVARLLRDDSLYAALSQAAEATWARVTIAADWSTMITRWVEEGRGSTYLRDMTLAAQKAVTAP